MKFKIINLFRFLKIENFIFLIFVPLYLNFFFNFKLQHYTIPHISIVNLFISVICFSLLFAIGSIVSRILNLDNNSIAIVIYLLSFFVFSFLSLSFIELSFNTIFLVVNIIWIFFGVCCLKIKKIRFELSTIFLFFLVNRILFNSDYLFYYVRNINFNSGFLWDVNYFWYPMTKIVYENSLYYAISENIISGYGLLIPFVNAVLTRLFFGLEEFIFLVPVTHIYLFLFLLFISELKLKKSSKLITVSLIIVILLNSDWLSFLFFSSLMGEGITSIFFVIISYFLSHTDSKTIGKKYNILLLILSFFYLSKPFLSYIIILYFFVKAIQTKRFIYIFFGTFGLLSNELIYNFNFYGEVSNNYINKETIFGLLNNLELGVVLNVLKNFIANDKISSFFILVYLLLVLFLIFKKYKLSYYEKINNFFILTNLLLVLILYASIWKSIEVGSAYRYIIITLPLLFINTGYLIDKVIKK